MIRTSILLLTLTSALSCPEEADSSSTFATDVSPNLRVRGGGFGHVHVWAELDDDVAGWFLLDTGAQGHRLDKSVAKQLGLSLRTSGTITGVGGSVNSFSAVATTLRVGPMTMSSPRFVIADVDGGDQDDVLGTLGSDFFWQSIVVYDQAGPSVAVYDPASFESPPVEWEECLLLAERPFARMNVEDQPVLLEIDTGGGEAVLLCTPAVDQLGLVDGRPSQDSRIFGPYGGTPVSLATLATVEVGAQRFDNVTGTLGVSYEHWMGSTEHDGLIGAPLLVYMVVIFDYTNERISFTDRRLYPHLARGFEQAETSNKSAAQATGEPDALNKASYNQAWWPTDGHGKHWLELTYAAPIQPTHLEVWGTYGQGALTSVEAITKNGQTITLDWAGEVQTILVDGLAQTTAPVDIDVPVVQLRFNLDCSRIEGTNVIDAVGLSDESGTMHWALEARADGSRHSVDRAQLVLPEALRHHAERLEQRAQLQAAASVRAQIESLGQATGVGMQKR